MNLLLKEQNIVFPTYLISVVKKYELKLEDFLLLSYFWNFKNQVFDVNAIVTILHLTENEILTSFNTLLCKKLIELKTIKDGNGKREEIVSLEQLYQIIDEMFREGEKKQEESDVYSIFEKEFGRPISSMEYEIIHAWIEKGFSEELILGALKEAVYNGVFRLNYIDKILYEWQRKGYKSMKEVSNQRFRRNENTDVMPQELFDYNWLDDNER